MSSGDTHGKHARYTSEPQNSLPELPEEGKLWHAHNNIGSGNSHFVTKYSRENYTSRPHPAQNARIIAVLLLVILMLYAGILGATAKLTFDSARNVKNSAQIIISEITHGEPNNTIDAANNLKAAASRMHNLTNNPFWALGSTLPIIGSDISAGRIYCAALDDLTSKLLLPMVYQLTESNAGPIIRADNSFNADALQIILKSFMQAERELADYDKELNQIGTPSIKEIAKLHHQAKEALPALCALAAASENLANEIHFLLGADGSIRSYTIMALNNSERHASGGLVGSFGVLTIDNGNLVIGEFNPYGVLGNYANGYEANEGGGPDLTNEEVNLFGRMNGFSPCDVTNNPDFPRAAINFSWMCQDNNYGNSDGVIALDPTILQELLQANNISVPLGNGDVIDGNNAVRYLLHDVYLFNNGTEQDAIFSEAANEAFNAIFTNPKELNFIKTGKAIWNSTNRHIQTWFPNSSLQEAFNILGFSGEIQHEAASPILGVYINDQTWSKISWYLKLDTAIGEPIVNPDGSTSYQVRTVLHNTLTEAEMADLPAYVFGFNKRKRSHDDMINCIYLYAPEGGTITNIQAQGTFMDPSLINYTSYYPNIQEASMQKGTYEGLDVWFGYTCMQMGDSIAIEYTVTTSPQAIDSLKLDTTPDTEKYK